MANQAPGSTAAGGGRGVFRSQLQIQESREGHQDEVKWPTLESEDSESQSSASSIFQQGRVPIGWLVSDSGSSAHDRSERASGGKDSQNTSSSSSAEQQAARLAGGRVQDVPDTLSGRGKGQPVQAGKTGYSSSSWFATTFEETEIEDLAATQEKKSSARGSSSSFGALTGAAVEFVSEQSGNSQPKEDEEIPEDVEQRCMDILMNLPLDDEGRLTSLGSQSHKSGTCKPCAYWFKRACKHGVACYNCHIAHEGQKPKRLRSTKAKIHKDIGLSFDGDALNA
ncbi:unnamed protein product [Symbiodinium sp. CCMP2592]|nr:unnamed protein product [Symbiodinium sp. CCMP2592]